MGDYISGGTGGSGDIHDPSSLQLTQELLTAPDLTARQRIDAVALILGEVATVTVD